MTRPDIHSLLVIGIDVVSLATSASKAGYEVYAVDYFGDQDLKRVCHGISSIVKQMPGVTCGQLGTNFNPKVLLQLTRKLKMKEIDATLLSTGLDDSPDILLELNDMIPILGNSPHVIQRIRDKTEFFQQLKRLGIPHPETATAEGFEETRRKAGDIGYPVLVKPSTGFGGAGIRKAQDSQQLEHAFQDASLIDEKVLVQEYIPGTPASMSLISSGSTVITLTLNEQLLGVGGQEEPFGYSGNIVPLSATKTVIGECESLAQRTILHFGLIGSNGVDLVISDEGTPNVIEVNPRFQGTLECVERVVGMSVVEAHVRACTQGILPTIPNEISGYCTRLILFASQRSVVPDLDVFEGVRDVPLPGVIVERGEPVCSIMADGAGRASSFEKADRTAESILKSLQSAD